MKAELGTLRTDVRDWVEGLGDRVDAMAVLVQVPLRANCNAFGNSPKTIRWIAEKAGPRHGEG